MHCMKEESQFSHIASHETTSKKKLSSKWLPNQNQQKVKQNKLNAVYTLLRANTMNSSSHHGGRQMFFSPQKSSMPISSAIWN